MPEAFDCFLVYASRLEFSFAEHHKIEFLNPRSYLITCSEAKRIFESDMKEKFGVFPTNSIVEYPIEPILLLSSPKQNQIVFTAEQRGVENRRNADNSHIIIHMDDDSLLEREKDLHFVCTTKHPRFTIHSLLLFQNYFGFIIQDRVVLETEHNFLLRKNLAMSLEYILKSLSHEHYNKIVHPYLIVILQKQLLPIENAKQTIIESTEVQRMIHLFLDQLHPNQ